MAQVSTMLNDPNRPDPKPQDPKLDETVSAMQWAKDVDDSASASVNWLAQDIDPTRPTAELLLSDPRVPLTALQSAKSAYKTLRVVGEDPEERRAGARWYAATIAAAMVHHDARISSQSERALDRAFATLVDDDAMPASIREIVVRALFRLRTQSEGP